MVDRGEFNTLAQSLQTDRLLEFQREARKRGNLGADGDGDVTPSVTNEKTNYSVKTKLNPVGKATTQETAPAKGAFMKEFFDQVNEINSLISNGKANVKQINTVMEKALQATTQEKQREVSGELNALVEETNKEVKAVKEKLEDLEEQLNKEKNSAGGQGKTREIRVNMQNQLLKKHQALVRDFQQAQQAFKEALQAQQVREMRLLMPGLSESEVKQRVEAGETSAVLVAQQIAGTHALLLDELDAIKSKHQDILRLERGVADCHQMMQEIALLVDQQGEMLDSIEINVHNAKNYVKKAESQLINARKAQSKGQRWMCCLAAVMLIILLAILSSVIMAA